MSWQRIKTGGSNNVLFSPSTILMDWTNFTLAGWSAALYWVTNPGLHPIQAQIQSSPDGVSVDIDAESRVLLPGQSWSVTVEQDRRWAWRITVNAQNPGDVCAATFGVDVLT